MASVVPESPGDPGPHRLAAALGEALDALLEVTGATAGWVGCTGPDGRLHFPVTRGAFAPAWLQLQQGPAVWGFTLHEGPALYNDLPNLPALGEPALHNLLCCPIAHEGRPYGHVALANKPGGFGSADSAIVLGVAQLLGHWLGTAHETVAIVPAPLLRLALDRAGDGVLVIDAAGTLVFANAAWAAWTGFRPEELIGRPAPFPFWVGPRELAALGPAAAAAPLPPPGAPGTPQPLGAFPFRHRSGSVFWCRVETVIEESAGQPLTIAFLRRVAVPGPEPAAEPLLVHYSFLDLADDFPFALALTDRQGKLLWTNSAFAQTVAPVHQIAGQKLRACFSGSGAAALERLFRAPAPPRRGQVGRLLLEHPGGVLLAGWLAVTLPDGPGYLFALGDNWDALCGPAVEAADWQRALAAPGPDRLALLLQPGAEVQFWDERWQALTGLAADDLAGVPTETVIDWLFPNQRDHDRVADLLHQPSARAGTQAVLDVLTRTGSRPLLCTFLPVGGVNQDRWLLLAGAAEVLAGEDSPGMVHVRRFARSLSQLLNHLLAAPLGATELALDRTDLPAELADLLEQVLNGLQRLTDLVGLLQDLGETSPGDAPLVPLAEVVQEFLAERSAVSGEPDYDLKLDVRNEAAQVRVNRRMLKTVLDQLLRNAEHALRNSPLRRIEVRVLARDDAVCCEIADTGEGLPPGEWARALVPFLSTKGPFARDAEHAALEATGLGLTVSQHLLGLHGGRLELRSNPEGGTTATVVLPRGDQLPLERRDTAHRRADSAEAHAPHAPPELTPAPEKKD
jgi:signal transduction histidine kinase